MGWRIEFSPSVDKELTRIGVNAADRILRFLNERVATLNDPRTLGQALKGPKLGNLWRYRVGDYRLVARIEDARIVVTVVTVAHRREVYRR